MAVSLLRGVQAGGLSAGPALWGPAPWLPATPNWQRQPFPLLLYVDKHYLISTLLLACAGTASARVMKPLAVSNTQLHGPAGLWRQRGPARRAQFISAAAAAAVAAPEQVTPHRATAAGDAAQHLQQQHPASSLAALLTATAADAIGALPVQPRTLHRAEAFDDVYEIGEVRRRRRARG